MRTQRQYTYRVELAGMGYRRITVTASSEERAQSAVRAYYERMSCTVVAMTSSNG